MKKIFIFLCVVMLFCTGCSNGDTNISSNVEFNNGALVTDDLGNKNFICKNARVVSCYASFAECWLLSGGNLIGVTDDAIEEHNLSIGDTAEIIGTVKNPDLEKIVSLNPDYVILSADLSSHLSLKDSLDTMKIPYGYFQVDTFEDYKETMTQFCNVNNRNDLFNKNVLAVEKEIKKIKSSIPDTNNTFLLLRAYSTGIKAKTDDNLAGIILNEFGLENIADSDLDILEDLSVEHIIKCDPDYIFITTMGNEDSAMNFFKENVLNNPAWSELSAIKNNNYYLLPKKLFHYKPNNRWSESYEYIAKLIWPNIFT